MHARVQFLVHFNCMQTMWRFDLTPRWKCRQWGWATECERWGGIRLRPLASLVLKHFAKCHWNVRYWGSSTFARLLLLSNVDVMRLITDLIFWIQPFPNYIQPSTCWIQWFSDQIQLFIYQIQYFWDHIQSFAYQIKFFSDQIQ